MTKELAQYEAARAALAKAVRVDEVKEIRNASIALKAYARMAKDREMEANAYELRARAERRLGEMLEAGKADRASQGGDRRSKDSKNLLKPTLKEAGIDNNLAQRARVAWAMTEKDFEDDLKDRREEILHPSLSVYTRPMRPAVDREVAREQRKERLKETREERRRQREGLVATHSTAPVVEPPPPDAEIIRPKHGTQSTAPEIISPTFTAEGAVNQTRFAEAMRSIKKVCGWLTHCPTLRPSSSTHAT